MIADTDSTAQTTTDAEASPLSTSDLYRLTLYKWRYALEAFGFDGGEVRALMFLKWLHVSHKLVP